MRELGINELGHVERAVVVPARRDGCGDHNPCRVDCLEDALEMALSSDLFDKYRRETLGP